MSAGKALPVGLAWGARANSSLVRSSAARAGRRLGERVSSPSGLLRTPTSLTFGGDAARRRRWSKRSEIMSSTPGRRQKIAVVGRRPCLLPLADEDLLPAHAFQAAMVLLFTDSSGAGRGG